MLIVKQEIESFISTNLEQPRPKWLAANTYAYQDEVYYKNYVYRSMIDGNINVIPSLNSGKWLLWGVDNSYAAIDMHSDTDSIMDAGLDFMEYIFYASGFSTLALGQVLGESVEMHEYDGADALLKTTVKNAVPDRLNAIDWYSYFFYDIGEVSGAVDVLFPLIHPATAKMKVVINKRAVDTGYVSSMIGGRTVDIGDVEFGVKGGFVDYSIRTTDTNGITTIVKRNVKETLGGSIVLPATRTQYIKRFVKSIMGDTSMFIFDPDTDSNYENLIMLGNITEFSLNLVNATKTYGTIEIEESL